MKKRAWLIALLLTGLLAAGFFYLSQKIPSLVEARIEAALTGYGVEDFRLGEPSWGLTGAGTSALTVEGRSGVWRFTVTARDLQARYQWRTLLEGEVASLTVAAIAIRVEAVDADDEPPEPLDLERWLADLEGLTLPVEAISVDRLQIDVALDSADLHLSGQALEVDGAARTVAGTFTVAAVLDDGPVIPELTFAATAGDGFPWLPDLDIDARAGGEQLVTGSLRLHPPEADREGAARAIFSTRVDQVDVLESLSPWLSGDAGSRTLAPLAVRLRAEGEAALPRQLEIAALSLQTLPLSGSLEGTLTTEGIADTGLETITANLDLGFSSRGNDLLLTANRPVTLSADFDTTRYPPIGEHLGWPERLPVTVAITAEGPLAVVETEEQQQPAVKGENVDVALSAGEEGGALSASLRVAQYSFSPGSFAARTTGTVNARHRSGPLPEVGITAKLATTGGAVSLSGDFRVPDWGVGGTYRGTGTDAARTLSTELTLDDLALLSKQAGRLGILIEDLELVSGTGTASASLSLLDRPDREEPLEVHKYRFSGRGLSGLAGGVAFTDLRIAGGVNYDGAWHSPGAISLDAGIVSAGVALSDIHVEAALKRSTSLAETTWSIDQLTGSLFSGDIGLARPATINYPFAGNALTITLSKLQLSEILGLYEKQGISGTGLISGEIPMVLTGEGVRIEGGSLHSVENGKIVFSGAKSRALKATNQQLAMALRLLENFNYETLRVGADFETSGDLQLSVTLWGNNPREFDGREVNFNINVEDNVYKLLEVLRLTDGITAEIERRLENR